jgi:hypothetical protein
VKRAFGLGFALGVVAGAVGLVAAVWWVDDPAMAIWDYQVEQ